MKYEVLRVSSRLILISVQMLLLTQDDENSTIQIYNSCLLPQFNEYEDEIFSKKEYLVNLHKKDFNFNSNQLKFDL